ERTLVVPTAMTRPPRALQACTAATTSGPTSSHSLCMWWSSIRSTLTGWKVPAPTCRVTSAGCTPRSRIAASSSLSKFSPAVHAEVRDPRQHPAHKMKPGRGRRHRTGTLHVDRLIPYPVGTLVRPIDVGGQRHVADAVKQRQNRLGKAQLEQGIVARQHADLA